MDIKEMTYMILEGVWTCDNCGAYEVVDGDDKPTNLKHHKTCRPGEAEYLASFYAEEDLYEEGY